MAAVEVTISGVLFDKVNRTTQNVVIIGEASLTGLGVGGGPIVPPGSPPGIWGGGNVPMPNPPIPVYPGGTPNPPGIWGGPIDPYPDHGLPEPPTETPPGEAGDDGFVKPPPEGGGWGYSEAYGWMYKPKEGQAGPKR